MSADTGRPFAYSFVPQRSATTVDVNDVMSVMFSEIVQAGTGSITVYSKTAACAHDCASGTVFMNADVSSFPLLHGVNGKTGYASSVLVVEPTSALTPSLHYSLKVPSTAFKDLSGNAFTGLTSYTAFAMSVTTDQDDTSPYLIT